MVGSAANSGEKQGGGVPNIVGSFFGGVNKNAGILTADGAFYIGSQITNMGIATGQATGAGKPSFSATNSSSLYQSIAEVRPDNYAVKIWKRTS